MGTSRVYGEGGIYRLDLYNKTHARIYPKKEDGYEDMVIFEIIYANKINKIMKIRITKESLETKVIDYPF